MAARPGARAGKETTPAGRRTSIGRPAMSGQKRKVDSELGPEKKTKSMDGIGGEPSKNPLEEFKQMMRGLGASIESIRTDIGTVRRELGAEIRKGNAATLELKKRMDDNDTTFSTKVAEVVMNLPNVQLSCRGRPEQWATCLLRCGTVIFCKVLLILHHVCTWPNHQQYGECGSSTKEDVRRNLLGMQKEPPAATNSGIRTGIEAISRGLPQGQAEAFANLLG